jgi:hypothetical protein
LLLKRVLRLPLLNSPGTCESPSTARVIGTMSGAQQIFLKRNYIKEHSETCISKQTYPLTSLYF